MTAEVAEALAAKRSGQAIAADSSANLCIDGRMAPELVLLGAAKASTTLFTANFNKSSDVKLPQCLPDDNPKTGCLPGDLLKGVKEMQFFNHPERASKGRAFWLQHFPECRKDMRLVVPDLSPGYLPSSEAPDNILSLYGDQIDAVKFLVLLRDPIDCMQSFFYYTARDKLITFDNWARDLIEKESTRTCYLFENSMYADHLRFFFSKIHPSQFIVVPWKYNLEARKGVPQLHEFIWEKLGLRPGEAEIVESSNVDEHTPLEDDLSNETFAGLRRLVGELTGPHVMAEILSSAEGNGPLLYGYKGAPGDVGAIATWLWEGW